MVKILNWNARGLGLSVKRRYLSDLIKDHNIDLISIQETKKQTFSDRSLRALSFSITQWFVLPSVGASGGLLLGFNDSIFSLVAFYIKQFSITVHLRNKINNFEWCYTTVYGPLTSDSRRVFLHELMDLGNLGIDAWLIMGDFNMIRRRSERTGNTFSHVISSRFNAFIRNNSLMELILSDRKYTWARSLNSSSQALLDRCFCTNAWNAHFTLAKLSSLSRVYSDHNPLLLDTQAVVFPISKLIKFDKTWLEYDGFYDLVVSWWNECPLTIDLGLSWKLKLQSLRRKFRGWSSNVRGDKKRMKSDLLNRISNFEHQLDNNCLREDDVDE